MIGKKMIVMFIIKIIIVIIIVISINKNLLHLDFPKHLFWDNFSSYLKHFFVGFVTGMNCLVRKEDDINQQDFGAGNKNIQKRN